MYSTASGSIWCKRKPWQQYIKYILSVWRTTTVWHRSTSLQDLEQDLDPHRGQVWATEIWLQFPIRRIWFITGSSVYVDILECFPLNWWDLWNHQDCRPSFDHSSFLSLACPFRTTWNGFHPLYQEQYPQLPPPPYSEGKMLECSKFMFKDFTPQSKTSLLSPAWPPFSNKAAI